MVRFLVRCCTRARRKEVDGYGDLEMETGNVRLAS
jgi:hypothetical protein